MDSNTAPEAVVARFFAAIEAGDTDTLQRLYHPGALVWHNTGNLEQDVTANLRVPRWVGRNVRGLKYGDIRRTLTGDGRVLQQHVLRGIGPSGTAVEIPAAIVFTVDSAGLVTRVEEYLDSAATAALVETSR
ncbi:MAG: nuclear transport factor 2 family protein [Dehalococcoidia bacterium]|nr:nuclear transport factor 2 family protein [Dehalococcoidia bacterium]